jgi:ABC-type multidrug transport system ATPase subunit
MEMLKRPLNVGFSGGEKKRAEILQMKLLEPKLCVLDETDSGLDIDALKIVADGVNSLRSPDRATIVITHYQRLLDYIVPDTVHVLSKGKIIKTGDKSLAHRTRGQGLRRHHQRGGLRRGRRRPDMTVQSKLPLTAAETALVEAFGEQFSYLPGNAGMVTLRDRAIQAIKETGLPTRRVEAGTTRICGVF